MAATASVLKAPHIKLNNVDLSTQCKEIALSFNLDELERTASGDATHVKHVGLENWSARARFYRNYGAASVEATLWAAKEACKATPFYVALVLRKDTAAKGTDNPEFTGNCIVSAFPPIGGAVGAEDEVEVTLSAAGDLGRATT